MLSSIEWVLYSVFNHELLNNLSLSKDVRLYLEKRVMELHKKSKEK